MSKRDNFSQTLLNSIPNKVSAWLRNLGMLKTQKGTLGPLSWRIRNNHGKSYIKINDYHITWQGPIGDVKFVEINAAWASNIALNMDQFVALEKQIYDEIQKVEDALFEDSKIQVPIMSEELRKSLVPEHDRVLQTLPSA